MSLALARSYMPRISEQKLTTAVVRKATNEDVIKEFNLNTLSQLQTSHMNSEQEGWFNGLLKRVRHWRKDVENNPQESFIISSSIGIGKTHISKAVMTTFATIIGDMEYVGTEPRFQMVNNALLYTAPDIIRKLGELEKGVGVSLLIPRRIRCLVIDDMGREGNLPYVKAENQKEEKRKRYFELINYLYEHRRVSTHGYRDYLDRKNAVSLFITTNLSSKELEDMLGAAVFSRLLQLCPRGNIFELSGIPDYRRVVTGRA